jgi:thiol-disulfide isomerase/thioredoxin
MRLEIIFAVALLAGIASASFNELSGHDLCTDGEGKPRVLMFSATTCPVCTSMIPVFKEFSGEYHGQINAALWQLDASTNNIDNLLTAEPETEIPLDVDEIRQEFLAYSPGIPRFVFGCRYYRSGQAYQGTGWQDKEKAEMRQILALLITECAGTCASSPGCCATGCSHAEDPDCLHEADIDQSKCLDNTELFAFLTSWRSDNIVLLKDLIDAIKLWKSC